MTKKQHKLLIIQLVIALPVITFIIYKIISFSYWDTFLVWLSNNIQLFIWMIMLQLLLSVINIFFETLKWSVLTSILHPQGFRENLRQVLFGILAGMITPAKIGESVGKAILLKKGNRQHGIILSFAGSFYQNLVIITAGLVAFFTLKNFFLFHSDFFRILSVKIFQYAILLPVIAILMLFGIYKFLLFLKKNGFSNKIRFYLQIIKKLKLKTNIQVLILTISRYAVFSFQMYIILYFFEIINLSLYVWLIPLYYLVITFIPAIALVDLGIRSSAALIIFGLVSDNTAGIISSVFIIWFFNLVIPSLVNIFTLRLKNQK